MVQLARNYDKAYHVMIEGHGNYQKALEQTVARSRAGVQLDWPRTSCEDFSVDEDSVKDKMKQG
jgi:hypothetical protein